MSARAAFPGGTSVSRLRVYDWPAPDVTLPGTDGGRGAGGAPGTGGALGAEGASDEGPADDALAGSGTPHLHTASAEGYVVVAGAGAVQTLGSEGFAETPLVPGAIVWFTPGVVHRLVNHGDLELVVVMSNAGLPEAGDAVLTFPPDVLADPHRYRAAVTLPDQDPTAEDDDVVAAAARARRDLALEGFALWRERFEADGAAGLAELYAAAARLVADRAPRWQEIVAEGVERTTAGTVQALADLARGEAPHLAASRVGSATARPGPQRYGMCGRLQTWEL